MEKTYNVLYTYVPGPRPDPFKIELVTDCGDLSVGDKVIWYNVSNEQYIKLPESSGNPTTYVSDPAEAYQFNVIKKGTQSSLAYMTLGSYFFDGVTKRYVTQSTPSGYNLNFRSTSISVSSAPEARIYVSNEKGNSDNRVFIAAGSNTTYKYLPGTTLGTSNSSISGSQRTSLSSTTISNWQLYKVIQQ